MNFIPFTFFFTISFSIGKLHGHTRACSRCTGDKEAICDTNGDRYLKTCEFKRIQKSYLEFGQRLKEWPYEEELPSGRKLGRNEFAECDLKCSCVQEKQESICASNLLIYTSRCFFDCMKASLGLEGTVCKDHTLIPKCKKCCSCPDDRQQICSTIGIYDNLCAFDCARTYFKSLGITIFQLPCPQLFIETPGDTFTTLPDKLRRSKDLRTPKNNLVPDNGPDPEFKVVGTRKLTIYQLK